MPGRSSVAQAAAQSRYARVDGKELPTLLRRMEACDGTPHARLALKLMALTFVRTGELIGARWEEFELGTGEWRVPASRMKMHTPHILPLSRQAVDVLRSLHERRGSSGLHFSGKRDHDKPISNNTMPCSRSTAWAIAAA
jgi:integrase